jgi:RNA polymerase sigma-70 factor (ECF subfamily)
MFGNFRANAPSNKWHGAVNDADRRAIAECLAGHTAAFEYLVRSYQDRLFNAILRVVDNPEDALDVVQDSFLNAYQSLSSFKGDSEFYTWLYRIAFNSAVSQRRKKKPTVSLEGGRNGEPIADPPDVSEVVNPSSALERNERLNALYKALNRLSFEHRAVLVMKDLDGLKYEEIADVMGVPIGTIRSRLHRARLELRCLLSEDQDITLSPIFDPPKDRAVQSQSEQEGEGDTPARHVNRG